MNGEMPQSKESHVATPAAQVDASAPVLAKIVQIAQKNIAAAIDVTAKVDGEARQVIIWLRPASDGTKQGQVYAVHSPQYEVPAARWAELALGSPVPPGDGEPEYRAYNGVPNSPVTAEMIDAARRDWAYGLIAAAVTWSRPTIKVRKRATTDIQKFAPSHWQRLNTDVASRVSSYEKSWSVICQALATKGIPVGGAHVVAPRLAVVIPGNPTFHAPVSLDALASSRGRTRAALVTEIAQSISSGFPVEFSKVDPPHGVVVPEALEESARSFAQSAATTATMAPPVERDVSSLIPIQPEHQPSPVAGTEMPGAAPSPFVDFPPEFVVDHDTSRSPLLAQLAAGGGLDAAAFESTDAPITPAWSPTLEPAPVGAFAPFLPPPVPSDVILDLPTPADNAPFTLPAFDMADYGTPPQENTGTPFMNMAAELPVDIDPYAVLAAPLNAPVPFTLSSEEPATFDARESPALYETPAAPTFANFTGMDDLPAPSEPNSFELLSPPAFPEPALTVVEPEPPVVTVTEPAPPVVVAPTSGIADVATWAGSAALGLDEEVRRSIMKRVHAATIQEVASLVTERDRAAHAARSAESDLARAREELDDVKSAFASVQAIHAQKRQAREQAQEAHALKVAQSEKVRATHAAAVQTAHAEEQRLEELLAQIAEAQTRVEAARQQVEHAATEVASRDGEIASTTEPAVRRATAEVERFERDSLTPAQSAVDITTEQLVRVQEQHQSALAAHTTLTSKVENAQRVLAAFSTN